MNVLITICARAKSSRLPGKNTRMLHGKPLFKWTFDVAQKMPYQVVVSSDDDTILASAKFDYNFQIIRRPAHLDDVGKIAQIRDALIIMEHQTGKEYWKVVDLDITNPMRTVDDVEDCIKESGGGVLVSVTNARKNPYFNQIPKQEYPEDMIEITKMGGPIEFIKSQNAPKVYDLNACIYVYGREFLLSGATSPINEKTLIHVMPDHTFCDIDTDLDFRIVDFLMKEYGYVETTKAEA